MKLRRLLAPLIALLVLAWGGAAAARPAFWIVRDHDSVIFLFGSMHVLPPGLDWRPPELDTALAEADDLWFETPLGPEADGEVRRLVAERGYFRRGRSLGPLLSPLGRERLARLGPPLGVAPAFLDPMEPWLAEMNLTMAAIGRSGASAHHGVEDQIDAAAPRKVRRRAFETVAFQIGIFDTAPLTDQLASLEDTLDEIETDPGAYDALLAAWLSGDVAALEAISGRRLIAVSPYLYRRLLPERNERWTRLIRKRLSGHGATVMVVGAAHLIGPDGIPARLRAQGVTVDGP